MQRWHFLQWQCPAQTGSELEFFKSLAKMTNQIKKYTPALREIYKDDPEKIKALNIIIQKPLTEMKSNTLYRAYMTSFL